MTTTAMLRCCNMAFITFSLFCLAIRAVKRTSTQSPRNIFTKTQVLSEKIRMGTMKVDAKISFAIKVEIVDFHTSPSLFFALDSWERWMPSASENASATAIVRMPPMTTITDPVHDVRPTISPSVVMMPEVMPKLIQVFMDCLMCSVS